MNFTQAVSSGYRKYFAFQGRASRSEYWWWFLFFLLSCVVVGVVEITLGLGNGMLSVAGGVAGGEASGSYTGGPLSNIWLLVNLLPGITISVRRLHDTDRSGWWYLIGFVPLVGAIVLLVFFFTKGTAGNNRFGADPLESSANVF